MVLQEVLYRWKLYKRLTDKEICKRLCMSKPTFYKRKRESGTLTVTELCTLAKAANLTDEEIVKIVKEA